MATIATTIQIIDAFSPALKSMSKALGTVMSSLEQTKKSLAGTALGSAIDTSGFMEARQALASMNVALDTMSQKATKAQSTVKAVASSTSSATAAFDKVIAKAPKLLKWMPVAVQEQNKLTNAINRSKQAASGLIDKIKGYLGAYAAYKGVTGTLGMADTMANTKARLSMVNDGSRSDTQLQRDIFMMAEKTRSSYQETAQIVGRIGMNAGAAFKGTDEVIKFTEQMNKMLIIGGATAQEQQSTIIQLSQALASGRLQGDELRSITENAPLVMEALARYLNKSKGELKDLGKEGKLSADVIKNAVLAMADETNARFKSMPKTWGQLWTSFKNNALFAFQPILNKLTEFGNSDFMSSLITRVMNGINNIAQCVGNAMDWIAKTYNKLSMIWEQFSAPLVETWNKVYIAAQDALYDIRQAMGNAFNNGSLILFVNAAIWGFNLILNVARITFNAISGLISFVKDNWSFIAPVIWGVVGAFLALKGAILISTIAMGIYNGLQAIGAFISAVSAAKLMFQTGATFAATAAQWGFNAALLACPLTWIVLAIIAVIVVIYLLVAAFNKATDSSVSATGIIFATFAWLFTSLYNMIAVLWNTLVSYAEFLYNVFTNPVYSLKKLLVSLGTMFLDLCISMTEGWDGFATDMANGMIDAINWVIKGWNKLVDLLPNKVKDVLGLGKGEEWKKTVSITGDLKNAKKELESWLGDAPDDYKSFGAAKMELKSMSKNAVSAYKKGDKLSNMSMDDLTKALTGNTDQLKKQLDLYDSAKGSGKYIQNGRPVEALGNQPNKSKLRSPYDKIGKDVDAIKNNTAQTSDNVDMVVDGLSLTEEELKMLRLIGEREAINRFTTSQVRVNTTNNNNINSDMDINKVVSYLTNLLTNAMITSSNAPHF